MGDAYVYDKTKYHMAAGVKSWEQASAPALFVLRWMIDRDFLNLEYWGAASESLAKYRGGQMSLYELYEKECDFCLVDDQFSEGGNTFGQLYFDFGRGRYLSDLESVLHYGRKKYPQFSEDAYLRVRPFIDDRYSAWKQGAGELTLPPGSNLRQLLLKVLGFMIVLAMFVGVYYFIWFLKWMVYPR